jgi:hypothetical protein
MYFKWTSFRKFEMFPPNSQYHWTKSSPPAQHDHLDRILQSLGSTPSNILNIYLYTDIHTHTHTCVRDRSLVTPVLFSHLILADARSTVSFFFFLEFFCSFIYLYMHTLFGSFLPTSSSYSRFSPSFLPRRIYLL